MKVTMLGCGSSAGVPLIGCDCMVCTSTDPKNKRTRVSVLVEVSGKTILIDSSPDLRAQALRHNIRQVDAVLYTHDHADHIHGIDDLRSFNFLADAELPIYAKKGTISTLKSRFSYVFLPRPDHIWVRPSLVPHEIPDDVLPYEFEVAGVKIIHFLQQHGRGQSSGFRIGNFAYCTDVDILPEESLKALEGTEYFIVDCLRRAPSYSHSHLENTLRWIEKIKPKQAILTHMSHEFDYDALKNELPSGVVPGYDGLTFELENP